MYLIAVLLHPNYLALAKLSILVLLYQIFAVRKFRIIVAILMAIVVAWVVSTTLAHALICEPLRLLWNPATPAHCGNQHLLEVISKSNSYLSQFESGRC